MGNSDARTRIRVAIVGSGPAGFYTAEHLFNRRPALDVAVDMFERLPVPYGLVRFGVAPDHQKIKSASKAFARTADNPDFRLFSNVEVGRHVSIEELLRHYHAVCLATGTETDRRMGIPGEDLVGSHTATEFVAWYNGHPDYCDREFDLSGERVAVVGVGNVAVDVARILCRLPEELERTDIADYALAALARSRVREVHMLGRRGPAQAAFTNAEVRELGELAGADIEVIPEEIALDPLSAASVARAADRTLERKLAILNAFIDRVPAGREKKLWLRFLVSPTELLGDDAGRVRALRLVHNELYETDNGTLRPRPTERYEEIPVDLVFRSVGYRGVAIPGVPFDERSGCIPNVAGRVVETVGGAVVPGVYASGWIKRGPSGVIGTNKPDAGETADAIVTDFANGVLPDPPITTDIEALVRERQRVVFSFDDWKQLDAIETARGAAVGRPRVKCVTRDEVERALGRS